MKMQEAIKRIDDGVFGICDVCGGPISEKTADGEAGDHPLHRLQDEAGKDGKAQGGITALPLLITNGDASAFRSPLDPRCHGERRGIFFKDASRMFVRVAIPIPSAKTFTYAVPDMFAPAVVVGKRVLVPFGKRRLTGFIIETCPRRPAIKPSRKSSTCPIPNPSSTARTSPFTNGSPATTSTRWERSWASSSPAGST